MADSVVCSLLVVRRLFALSFNLIIGARSFISLASVIIEWVLTKE
jgi:hypothetical protein